MIIYVCVKRGGGELLTFDLTGVTFEIGELDYIFKDKGTNDIVLIVPRESVCYATTIDVKKG